MSQTRPDLDTVKQMLARERRRRSIRRWIGWTLGILAVGVVGAMLILQTEPFADVYRMLLKQLRLV